MPSLTIVNANAQLVAGPMVIYVVKVGKSMRKFDLNLKLSRWKQHKGNLVTIRYCSPSTTWSIRSECPPSSRYFHSQIGHCAEHPTIYCQTVSGTTSTFYRYLAMILWDSCHYSAQTRRRFPLGIRWYDWRMPDLPIHRVSSIEVLTNLKLWFQIWVHFRSEWSDRHSQLFLLHFPSRSPVCHYWNKSDYVLTV